MSCSLSCLVCAAQGLVAAAACVAVLSGWYVEAQAPRICHYCSDLVPEGDARLAAARSVGQGVNNSGLSRAHIAHNTGTEQQSYCIYNQRDVQQKQKEKVKGEQTQERMRDDYNIEQERELFCVGLFLAFSSSSRSCCISSSRLLRATAKVNEQRRQTNGE